MISIFTDYYIDISADILSCGGEGRRVVMASVVSVIWDTIPTEVEKDSMHLYFFHHH